MIRFEIDNKGVLPLTQRPQGAVGDPRAVPWVLSALNPCLSRCCLGYGLVGYRSTTHQGRGFELAITDGVFAWGYLGCKLFLRCPRSGHGWFRFLS